MEDKNFKDKFSRLFKKLQNQQKLPFEIFRLYGISTGVATISILCKLYIHVYIIPSSSCLKIIVLGISIIGVMLPNSKEISADVLVRVGNRMEVIPVKSSSIRICTSMANDYIKCIM